MRALALVVFLVFGGCGPKKASVTSTPGTPAIDAGKTFLDYCREGKRGNEAAAWHTVEVLMRHSQESDDCVDQHFLKPDPNCPAQRYATNSTFGLPKGWKETWESSVTCDEAWDGLRQRKRLFLAMEGISDLSPFGGLVGLQELNLHTNSFKDLSPLTRLTGLKELFLMTNGLKDISPLAELTNLEELLLDMNSIEDASPLAGLKNLKSLSLSANQVRDVSALRGLVKLEELRIANNAIDDLRPLASLMELRQFNADHYQIEYEKCPVSSETSRGIRRFCMLHPNAPKQTFAEAMHTLCNNPTWEKCGLMPSLHPSKFAALRSWQECSGNAQEALDMERRLIRNGEVVQIGNFVIAGADGAETVILEALEKAGIAPAECPLYVVKSGSKSSEPDGDAPITEP